MNPVPAAVNAPRTPSVNLLPPEIEQRRAKKRARNFILLGVVGFFFLVLAAWFYFFTAHKAASNELAAEQARTTDKQTELATYSYIPLLEAQLANSVEARKWTGQKDIDWATQLDAIFGVFPKDVHLTSLVVTAASPTAQWFSDGTPLGVPDLGSLTFAGTSAKPIDVAALEDALDALPGFANTSIQVTAIETGEEAKKQHWTYSGTVRITENALSHRTETTQEVVPLDENGQPVTTEGEG